MAHSSTSKQNLLDALRQAQDSALPTLQERLTQPRLALLLDIDGTISSIAPSPQAAAVDPQCKRALLTLAPTLTLLAFVSGRPAQEAAAMVGISDAIYLGVHGLDRWEHGERSVHPDALKAQQTVQEAAKRLQGRLQMPGLLFEDKGLTYAVHYRAAADPDAAHETVLDVARQVAAELSMRLLEGRRVVELQPSSIEANKGTAVFALLQERQPAAALYLGDDSTDAAAIQGVHRWAAQRQAWGAGAAVLSNETPEELLSVADYQLDGMEAVRRFLAWLAETRSA